MYQLHSMGSRIFSSYESTKFLRNRIQLSILRGLAVEKFLKLSDEFDNDHNFWHGILQFPSAICWRKKKIHSYNHKTTIWVSHEYYLNPEFHKILSRAF